MRVLVFSKREWDGMEAALAQLEEGASRLSARVERLGRTGEGGYTALAEATEQLEQAETELEAKQDRWIELAELVENGGE